MDAGSLPPCRWRRERIAGGRYACVSPKLIVSGRGVPEEQCRSCYCCDHPPRPRQLGPCVHLGPHEGDIDCVPCGSVGGRPRQVPLHVCAAHGKCTIAVPMSGVACCVGCAEHVPRWQRAEAGQIRHLTYHILPTGDAWRWNCDQLRARLSLFNGRRIISIACDPAAEPPEAVEAEFAGLDVEFWRLPNDRGRKEMVSVPRLVAALEPYRGPADVTFYAHAKGVTSERWAPGSRRWTTAMYSALLDHWPAVERELRSACVVGIFRRFRCGVPDSAVKWHFSGTFRWTRNADLYARNWRACDAGWCGSESYPAVQFRPEETACLHSEFASGGLGLYLEETWQSWASASVAQWESDHMADWVRPVLCTVILTAHAQPQRVHEAIASVRAQSSDSWQLLIVDSGRIASTGAYERYAPDARIHVMLTGETAALRSAVGIQSWAINEAWRRGRVRGDIVLHLCDDDILHPAAVENFIAQSRRCQYEGAWYGWASRTAVGPDGSEMRLGRLGTVGVGRPGNSLRCRVDGMQVCFRRSARTDWPELRQLAPHADGYWMDALAQKVEVIPVDFQVGSHRHTPESTFTQA